MNVSSGPSHPRKERNSYYDCIKAINFCIKTINQEHAMISWQTVRYKIVEGISLLTNRTQIFISRYDTFTLPFSGKMSLPVYFRRFPSTGSTGLVDI